MPVRQVEPAFAGRPSEAGKEAAIAGCNSSRKAIAIREQLGQARGSMVRGVAEDVSAGCEQFPSHQLGSVLGGAGMPTRMPAGSIPLKQVGLYAQRDVGEQ